MAVGFMAMISQRWLVKACNAILVIAEGPPVWRAFFPLTESSQPCFRILRMTHCLNTISGFSWYDSQVY